jgi:hypothetical protein
MRGGGDGFVEGDIEALASAIGTHGRLGSGAGEGRAPRMPELDIYSAELVKKVAEHCGWRAEVLGEGVVRLMGERRTRRGVRDFQWREDLLALLLGLLRCVCVREREREKSLLTINR